METRKDRSHSEGSLNIGAIMLNFNSTKDMCPQKPVSLVIHVKVNQLYIINHVNLIVLYTLSYILQQHERQFCICLTGQDFSECLKTTTVRKVYVK